MPDDRQVRPVPVRPLSSLFWPRSTGHLGSIATHLRGSTLFLNLFSVTGATVVSRLIGLVVLGYPARVLGPENYGLVGFGLSVTAYAGILLSPGLITWGTRAIARDRAGAGGTLVAIRLIQLVLACCSYAALFAYAMLFLEKPSDRVVVLLCGFALFNSALSVDWVFNGLELMRYPAAFGVLSSVLHVVALLTLVRTPNDVYIFAIVSPGTGAIIIVLQYLLLLQKIRPAWLGLSAVRCAFAASLPLGITSALVVVLHYANNLIVHAYLGSAALGIFLAAFRLVQLGGTLPGLLSAVFLPRLARVAVENSTSARKEARLYAQALILTGAFVAAIIGAEAKVIIGAIYGTQYEAAASLLRIMAVAVFFNHAVYGYTNALISYGKDRVMILVVGVSAVVSVGGGFLLVPHLGAIGAAIVVAGIDFVAWLVSLPYYRRTVGSLHFKSWVRPLLGAGTVILLSAALQSMGMSIWIRLPLSVGTYLAFAFQEIKAIYASNRF